jgi:putative lipoic acid-binding regulatory protein
MDKETIITYPCSWLYKIIGEDQEQMRLAAETVITEESCSISVSNSSKTGKYHCLNVELTVHTEEQRNTIFTLLKKHPHIKMVL